MSEKTKNAKKLLAMEWIALNFGLTLMAAPIVVFLIYAFTWIEVFPTDETGVWMFFIGLGMFLFWVFVQGTPDDKGEPDGVLVTALVAARKTMRNCQMAIESNQVIDKDVIGNLERGQDRIDAAIKAAKGEA